MPNLSVYQANSGQIAFELTDKPFRKSLLLLTEAVLFALCKSY